jgi:hypothetical protein
MARQRQLEDEGRMNPIDILQLGLWQDTDTETYPRSGMSDTPKNRRDAAMLLKIFAK